jgi:hypothetical protein
MAFGNGPKIVTNGLVLSLDAADRNSYSGTGTVWNDLSGNNNNGTLVSGATYSSNNGGGIVFDGIDDYIDLKNKPKITLNTFSYSCWFYPTSFNISARNGIFSREDARHYILFDNNGQYLIFLRGNLHSSSGRQFETWIGNAQLVQLNKWSNVTVNVDWTLSTFSVYHNASLIWSLTDTLLGTSFINTSSQDAVIGARYGGTQTQRLIGSVSNFNYYNRVLTQTEIIQNYNAQKSRFNLS